MNFKNIILTAVVASFATGAIAETVKSDSGNIGIEDTNTPKKRKKLDSFFDGMNLTNSKSYYTELDPDVWTNGWIAQSYFAETVEDALVPNDSMLMDRWLDHGEGIWSTDHLHAFDSEKTYLYSAAHLRSAAIKIDKPGRYRLRLHTDRYDSKGQQKCLTRVAIDGSTIIDEDTTFRNLGGRVLESSVVGNRYFETKMSASPVLDITSGGMYRLDFYSFCRDIDNQMEIYKNAFHYGNLNVRKSGFLSQTVEQANSYYGGSSKLRGANDARMLRNPIKQSIANNHGTIFEFVLENVDTEERRPFGPDDFWHLKKDTPEKKLLRSTMSPPSTVSLAHENWVFWGYKDRLTNNYSYEQPFGINPNWASAVAAMTPFVQGSLDYIEAARKIYIPEAGVWGIAVGYEPSAFSMDKAQTYAEGQSSLVALGTLAASKSLKQELIERPVSEHIDLQIQKELPAEYCEQAKADWQVDGSCTISIPLINEQLMGAQQIGELKINWINLPKGEFKLVQKRNVKELVPYRDERMGTINVTSIFSNGGYSLFLKGPSDMSFKKLR